MRRCGSADLTVPETLNGYDLTGARIWFQFHAEANGPMPEILYFNGRRVAMGDDLEPTVLFDQAKPGDKVTVAVKLLHTVDTKNFRGATLSIDFPEGRPNPEDLREEFLSAALLVPSLAPGDAGKMATLNGAIQAVDLAALDAHDQAKFDASLKASHRETAGAGAAAAEGDVSSDRQLAHRCGVAVALDGNGGRGEADVRHGAATDVRVSAIHLYAIGGAIQRVDGAEVSGDECGDCAAHQGGALGGCGRDVG